MSRALVLSLALCVATPVLAKLPKKTTIVDAVKVGGFFGGVTLVACGISYCLPPIIAFPLTVGGVTGLLYWLDRESPTNEQLRQEHRDYLEKGGDE